MCVNNLAKVALDSAAAGIEPATLQSQVQRLNHCTTERYMREKIGLIRTEC